MAEQLLIMNLGLDHSLHVTTFQLVHTQKEVMTQQQHLEVKLDERLTEVEEQWQTMKKTKSLVKKSDKDTWKHRDKSQKGMMSNKGGNLSSRVGIVSCQRVVTIQINSIQI